MALHGLTARALARELDVPPNRVTAILDGERAVTAATAPLLARRFGTSAEFWMDLQTAHDLELARAAMGEAA
jgi:antitoxin HigA-1